MNVVLSQFPAAQADPPDVHDSSPETPTYGARGWSLSPQPGCSWRLPVFADRILLVVAQAPVHAIQGDLRQVAAIVAHQSQAGESSRLLGHNSAEAVVVVL